MPPTNTGSGVPTHYEALLDIIEAELTNLCKVASAVFRQMANTYYPPVNSNSALRAKMMQQNDGTRSTIKTETLARASLMLKNVRDGKFIRDITQLPLSHTAFLLANDNNLADALGEQPDTTNMTSKEAKDAKDTYNDTKELLSYLDTIRALIIEASSTTIIKIIKDKAPIDIVTSLSHIHDTHDLLAALSETYNRKDVTGEAERIYTLMTDCKHNDNPTTGTIGQVLSAREQINGDTGLDQTLCIFTASNLANPNRGTERNKLAQEIITDLENPMNAVITWTLQEISKRLRTIETQERIASSVQRTAGSTAASALATTAAAPTTSRLPPVPRKPKGDINSRLGSSTQNTTNWQEKIDQVNQEEIDAGAQFRDGRQIRCTACCQIAHYSHSSANCNYYTRYHTPHPNVSEDIINSRARQAALKRLEANNMTLDTKIDKRKNNHLPRRSDRPSKRSKSPPQAMLTTTKDSETSSFTDEQNAFNALQHDNQEYEPQNDNQGYDSDTSLPSIFNNAEGFDQSMLDSD